MIAPSADTLGAIAYPLAIDVLRERGGLIFASQRRKTVESALGRVMQRVGVHEPERFAAILSEAGPVFDEVMALVTVGETYFFRESAQFAVLRERVFPEYLTHHSARRARIWSAACATGEETYSLAIAAAESHVTAAVIGTDVSRTRLAAARRGRFREWSMRGVPRPVVDRYFSPVDNEYCIAADLRREVRFSYLNLASGKYPSPTNDMWGFDVIFCRNVLIYFDAETIAHVAKRLVESLTVDGYLFLGASDPPLMDLVDCDVVQTHAGFVYRRATSDRPRRWDRPATMPAFPAPAIDAPPKTIPVPPPIVPPPVDVAPEIASAGGAAEQLAKAYRAREYTTAAAIGQAMFARGDDNVGSMILTIRALANAGELQEAERLCTAALDRHGDVAELRSLMATLLLQSGHPRAAATEARRAVYLDRTLGAAYLTLADALVRLDDPDAARQILARVERVLQTASINDDGEARDDESPARLLAIARAKLRHLHEVSAE